jgi:hypothetical protein
VFCLLQTAEAMVFVMISNCGPEYRLNYLQQLMDNGVTVHSFGSCMRNQELPADPKIPMDKYQMKEYLMSQYKFTFSFENSRETDYVTEKLFGPLAAGSVPSKKKGFHFFFFSIFFGFSLLMSSFFASLFWGSKLSQIRSNREKRNFRRGFRQSKRIG